MDVYELEIERKANIEYLDSILKSYQSTERKCRKIFVFIIVICAIAIYFMFFDLLGGMWGYIVTIAIMGVVAYLVSKLGISFKNSSLSDGKLAYQACVTMEVLIAIKKGTYRQYGTHLLTTGSGRHYDLYKQFIEMYPEHTSKDLERLSKIEVKLTDIRKSKEI